MDLAKKYLLWHDKVVKNTYSVNDLLGFGDFKTSSLRLGAPLMDHWPATVVCDMIDGDPRKPAFSDSLLNTFRQLIVSERLKKALEKLNLSHVEYLPVGAQETDQSFTAQFYIVHLLDLPDCLDLAASEAKISRINNAKVDSIEKLHLSSDPERALCRPINYGSATLISWDLAQALAAIGFSGIAFRALFDHPTTEESRKGDPLQAEIKSLNERISQALPMVLEGKPQQIEPLMAVPEVEINAWRANIDDEMMANGETFIPMPGEDIWLEGYNDSPEQWPAFESKKYFCLGSNDQSNYWLLDLGTGGVVYFSHEAGYNRLNFSEVAKSFKDFTKLVVPK